MRKRVLHGTQPSGKLHLGNYFGAMSQHVAGQDEFESFIFIANYHALNTIHDAETLRQFTLDVALDYLAVGLDPEKAYLYRQSDVPEVTELTWILSTVTGKGLLERAVSYKDKVARGQAASMGLFCYPVLQAADILIVDSDLVPVGKDQVQHIEMTADMAGYFNGVYGADLLKQPAAKLNDAAIVPGIDGEKMSKSYGNAIELFDTPKNAKKRIMSIKTDSTPVEDSKNPHTCNVFALLRLFASPEETAEWATRYRAGGMGYGDVKKRVAELFEELIGPFREKREQLVKDAAYVEDILSEGGRKVRAEAQKVMERVRSACGIVVSGR
ncbi:MAG: tryptophan--tRNA ligase [Phycisphaerales bacterium]|nr:tryptophan--tRNA ligase [Phycisphaerales bacterium]MCB9856397.1 tryptophan--tRNA ligase [Phycisphaerales bacterium]MCB9864528.1 tryptophan--tRNA ligase [Phycisphaerales bacterium]